MFRRLFGESDMDQLQYLEVRSIITIIVLVISTITSFFAPDALALVAVVMLFVWGWDVVKSLFGITAVGALFSGNVVVGVILFVLYLIIAYLAGVIFAFLGVGRWIYLKAKYRTQQ